MPCLGSSSRARAGAGLCAVQVARGGSGNAAWTRPWLLLGQLGHTVVCRQGGSSWGGGSLTLSVPPSLPLPSAPGSAGSLLPHPKPAQHPRVPQGQRGEHPPPRSKPSTRCECLQHWRAGWGRWGSTRAREGGLTATGQGHLHVTALPCKRTCLTRKRDIERREQTYSRSFKIWHLLRVWIR